MRQKQRWGRRLTRWHDEVGPLHLLNDDNSPACGIRYYATGGAVEPHPGERKCLRCATVASKRARGEQ